VGEELGLGAARGLRRLGRLPQRLLGPLPLGDVGDDRQQRRPAVEYERVEDQLGRELGPVGPPHQDLLAVPAAGEDGVLVALPHLVARHAAGLHRGGEPRRRLADHLVAAAPERRQQRLVAVEDAVGLSRRGHDDDPVAGPGVPAGD